VRYVIDGHRIRKHFADQGAAAIHLQQMQQKLEMHGTAALTASPHEIDELRKARELLPDAVSLVDAARAWLRHREARPVDKGPTLREAWVAFFEAKLDRSDGYRMQLESQCEPLLEVLGWARRFTRVQPEEIEAALKAGDVAEETRANRRRMLATFTAWTVSRYRMQDDPMTHVRTFAVKRGTPRFYSPQEMAALFAEIEQRAPQMLAGLALRAFAGLREVELKRMIRLELTPDVRMRDRTILIRSEIAKATGPEGRGRPRLIESLPPTVWRFLKGNAVWWPRNPAEVLRPAMQAIGMRLIKNGLRHTFVTYAAAHYESLEKAAMVAGHSTDVLKEHYRGLATRAQARRYFAIKPT
jgi:hypothetical protein